MYDMFQSRYGFKNIVDIFVFFSGSLHNLNKCFKFIDYILYAIYVSYMYFMYYLYLVCYIYYCICYLLCVCFSLKYFIIWIFVKFKKFNYKHNSKLCNSRNRNMYGIRLMWNKNQPITFGTKWNPFSSKIPFATFASHPLFFHKGIIFNSQIKITFQWLVLDIKDEAQRKIYDVSEFVEAVCAVITELDTRKIHEPPCIIHHKDILLENYFSIGSIIHNRNALGYFKVRGKFSF